MLFDYLFRANEIYVKLEYTR